MSTLNVVGLHHDDVLYETPEVKEALRRLPQDIVDERNYRLMRAMHLSMTKTILPKNEWTKYEEGELILLLNKPVNLIFNTFCFRL